MTNSTPVSNAETTTPSPTPKVNFIFLNKGSKNGLTSGNNAYVAKTKITETAILRKTHR